MLRKVATGIMVVAFSVISCAYQPTFVVVQIPDSAVTDANDSLRLQVSSVLEQKARTFGLTLDTRDLLYLCRDDFIMINTGVAGFENVESSAGVIAVDVGMIYLSEETQVRFGDGKLGSRLPTGFYAIRATVSQSSTVHDPGITLLEIFNSSGASILEFQATALPPSDKRTLTASLGIRSSPEEETDAACFGWVAERFGCEMCVVIGRDT